MTILDQLDHIRRSVAGIYPELFLAVFFLSLLTAELLPRERKKNGTQAPFLFFLNVAGAVVTLLLLLVQWYGERGFVFYGLLFIGSKAVFFKILIVLAWLFTLFHLYRLKYRFPPELQALLVGAVLAACLLCMAANLLLIYLTVEMLSLASYLLVALSPTSRSAEGGLKYLLFGTVSSAVMLYGISFIYGLTGSLDIATEGNIQGALAVNPPLVLYVTTLLTFGGLLFKLSLVPFHVWTPDAYEAAPTPVVSFLSVVPKIAVLLVVLRLVHVFPVTILPLLGGIALLSMTAGNVGALGQTNARRLLAYSTIAQAGYLLVGVVAFSSTGFQTATFYLAAYTLLNLSAFFLIDSFAPRSETDFSRFFGRGPMMPVAGIALTIVMVGLAGLPPTVGFTGKWLIFSALWESYQVQQQPWMMVLLLGGILNAAVSLVYYLKLPYLLFFKTGSRSEEYLPVPDKSGPFVAGILLVLIVLLFLNPQLLMRCIEIL